MSTTTQPPADGDATELLATRAQPTLAQATDRGDPAAPLPAGARLGRYRIEGLLGRGGMGEVYRAKQLEPVRRTVALKLLRRQRLGARHLAHFEVERQLLARMRHPAIAQVYDADTTAEGHPFFAMEYIAGSPLTRFCEEHALSLRQRLELLIRICEGVQHAHQKGVIHRDLKPGNLLVDLVDGRPLPKIIDFGIATAAGGGGREIAGTPDYMSPEQAGGDQSLVDTRSDVYALGVVLYELLTGTRPAAAGETVTADSRSLRLPSQELATLPPGEAERLARSHGLRLPRMRRLLRHELDWVVARALAHDRADRYPSAVALAEDLQRFLDGLPLQAVPRTRRYAWGKFVRRNRGALAAASVALLALLGGLGLSLYGLQQARTQRALAEQRSTQLEKVAAFQQSMLEGVDIEAMGAGLADGLRRQLDKAAPADRAALEQALSGVSTADVARGLIDRDILAGAEAAIARDFAAEPALAADLRASVAGVREALGLPAAAAEGYRQVADYRERALGAGALPTLQAREAQASALLAAARPQDAMALLQRVLPHALALPEGDATRLRLRLDEASAVSALGDRPRARRMLDAVRASALATRGERDPATMEITNALAMLLGRMGEPKAGRALLERLVPLRSQVLGTEHEDTLAAIHNLAVMRILTGDAEQAVASQRELVAIQTRRLGAEHPTTLLERNNLASMLSDAQRTPEAIPLQEATLAAARRVLGADHPQTLRVELNLSSFHARVGDFAKAIPLQLHVAQTRARLLGPLHPDTLYIELNRAATLYQAGQAGAALVQLARVLPQAREVLGDAHPQTQMGFDVQAQAADAAGDRALAKRSWRTLLEARAASLGERDAKTVDAAWQLEGLLRRDGAVAEADALRARYVLPLLDADPATLDEGQKRKAEDIRVTEREERAAARGAAH
ncbi:MAG TPA: serine/threonine-protein kinase [Xanthomonadaceae bacterium]|nr:serine/threonine-protein kinase [Xanthomonadaceae bacterium]